MPELNEHDAELLSAYINGELTAEEVNSLERRLTEDAFLRRELAALRQIAALIQALPEVKAPRNFTLTPEMVAKPTKPMPQRNVSPPIEMLPATIAMPKTAPISKTVPRRRLMWQPIAAAAAVFILAVGFMGVIFSNQGQAPSMVAAAPSQPPFTNAVVSEEMPEEIAQTESLKASESANDSAVFAPDMSLVVTVSPTLMIEDVARIDSTMATSQMTGNVGGSVPSGAGGDAFTTNQTGNLGINPDPNMHGFTAATLAPDALYYQSMTPMPPEMTPYQFNPVPPVAAQMTFAPDLPTTMDTDAQEGEPETAGAALPSPNPELDGTTANTASAAESTETITIRWEGVFFFTGIYLLQQLVNVLTGQP